MRRPVPVKRLTIQRRPKVRARRWQLPPVRRMNVSSGLNRMPATTSGKGRAQRLSILPITSRAPRQPKEATDAPAIIIQGRRGIVLSGQVTVRFDGEAAPQTFDF